MIRKRHVAPGVAMSLGALILDENVWHLYSLMKDFNYLGPFRVMQ